MNKDSRVYHIAWVCYMKLKMVVTYTKSIPYRFSRRPLKSCSEKDVVPQIK